MKRCPFCLLALCDLICHNKYYFHLTFFSPALDKLLIFYLRSVLAVNFSTHLPLFLFLPLSIQRSGHAALLITCACYRCHLLLFLTPISFVLHPISFSRFRPFHTVFATLLFFPLVIFDIRLFLVFLLFLTSFFCLSFYYLF